MYSIRFTLPTALAGALLLAGISSSAWADEEHENMKILEHTGPRLKKSMKDFSKGVGVKCTACHVKKDFESEEKALKDKSRPFFEAVVGESDAAKREAALSQLLKLLELETPRDEAKLWKGIDAMKKKAP